jgi:tetratricopeptide (TPR) repeat protein
MLQAIMSLRHPGVRFEVVNAAMTGINSHTILPIARDCARAGGDIWVIYMGNNEVVGPFGAGTVFGPRVPALTLIRSRLAVQATRTGQLLEALRERLWKPPPEKSEWGGMTMFLDQQVRADDSRLNTVYHHFRRNLADIIETAERARVGIVLSTVAVNLKDCAPFASAHRQGLSDADQAAWNDIYQRGIEAESAGRPEEAASLFRQAATLDDTMAELRFRQGTEALASGNAEEAERQFRAARDLDPLRFRCDSRLNDLIRQAKAGREHERLRLADAESAFDEESLGRLPGGDLFYDHVHLTFAGNYLLARTIGDEVEKLLPSGTVTNGPWPTALACAQRLAWTDRSRQAVLSDLFRRFSQPPFTAQLNHEAQLQRLRTSLEQLASPDPSHALAEARRSCEAAVASVPDDPVLRAQLASVQQAAGDLAGATTSARAAVELLPSSSEAWSQLGANLALQNQFDESATAFRRAFEWDRQDVFSMQNCAQALAKLDRRAEALRIYRQALAIKPRFGPAWLGLGQLLEQMGNQTEAEECYRKALANPVLLPVELAKMARFCQGRRWFDAAATNYASAVMLSPLDAKLQLEAGQNLEALGRRPEAAKYYAEAVRQAPGMMLARYLYGLNLGKAGKAAEAAEQFREAVRLKPDLVEARLNLATALMHQGLGSEALDQFEEVLRQNPTNALALRQAQELRAKLHSKPPP